MVSVKWSEDSKSQNKEPRDPFTIYDTEKTFRMGERFVFKNCLGKNISEDQARKLFGGQTIQLSRTGKKGKYTAKATLKPDGTCKIDF